MTEPLEGKPLPHPNQGEVAKTIESPISAAVAPFDKFSSRDPEIQIPPEEQLMTTAVRKLAGKESFTVLQGLDGRPLKVSEGSRQYGGLHRVIVVDGPDGTHFSIHSRREGAVWIQDGQFIIPTSGHSYDQLDIRWLNENTGKGGFASWNTHNLDKPFDAKTVDFNSMTQEQRERAISLYLKDGGITESYGHSDDVYGTAGVDTLNEEIVDLVRKLEDEEVTINMSLMQKAKEGLLTDQEQSAEIITELQAPKNKLALE